VTAVTYYWRRSLYWLMHGTALCCCTPPPCVGDARQPDSDWLLSGLTACWLGCSTAPRCSWRPSSEAAACLEPPASVAPRILDVCLAYWTTADPGCGLLAAEASGWLCEAAAGAGHFSGPDLPLGAAATSCTMLVACGELPGLIQEDVVRDHKTWFWQNVF
jgi:hypothetical protein